MHDDKYDSISSLANFDKLPDSALVGAKTLSSLIDVSRTTINGMVKNGLLPPSRAICGSMARWNVGEIREALKKLNDEATAKSRRGGYRERSAGEQQ
jgi:predicted DNA-binding transcriptional regulator AlpA